jgi:hypothetical protein
MNTNNISRYGASFPLQTQFVTNNDGCGDHVFTQLKRDGNVCLYSRAKVTDGRSAGFEVIITKTVKAGAKLPGNNVVEKDYETYPGAHQFGKNAWFCATEAQGEEKFEQIVKGEVVESVEQNQGQSAVYVPVVNVQKTSAGTTKVENMIIPDGEFTQAKFAVVNGLPERGVVWSRLDVLVKTNKLRKGFSTQSAGRPIAVFTKI